MSDPSDSRVPPDRGTVELALRVATARAADERPGSYWYGAVETLRWALGQRASGPVSEDFEAVSLETPTRPAALSEQWFAYECMTGARPTEISMRFLTGVENTSAWIATGAGFAETLDRDWLREHYGIE